MAEFPRIVTTSVVRAAGRGLRGIAFYRNRFFIASSIAILEFDRDFT
jgi:hypothetical protein